MAKGKKTPNPLKAPKRAFQKLHKIHEQRKLGKRAQAMEKALRVHAGYAEEIGVEKEIKKEIIRISQIFDSAFNPSVPKQTTPKERIGQKREKQGWSEKRRERVERLDGIQSRLEKRKGEKARSKIEEGLLERIIVVPAESPLHRKIFGKPRVTETLGIKIRDSIFLSGKIFERGFSEGRSILRHELVHCMFQAGEIVAYCFDSREAFERCETIEELEEKHLKKVAIMDLAKRKARTEAKKKYYQEAILGLHGGALAAMLNKKLGKEAADFFLRELRYRSIAGVKIESLEDLKKIRDYVTANLARKRRLSAALKKSAGK